MSPSPTASSSPDATTLVPTPPGRGRADASGGARSPDASRVARLWEAIRRTRDELEARERHERWIGSRFEALIRPRERLFTSAVCRTTERLVAHHESTRLDIDERTLLGLWINENLQSLATHPFAPRASADALARRWSRHLGTVSHPLDVPLASLYARQGGPAPGATRDGGHGDTGEDDAREDTVAENGADATSGFASGDADAPGPRERVSPGARGHRPDDDGFERATAEADAAAREAPDRIVARLFRRLARVLHPDREPDESRRLVKHALMSECLRARDEGDIDTLLSLHAEHVGELPDDVAGDDPAELAALLRRQLETLRHRLRRRLESRDLGAMIVARYAAPDRHESERRFAAHAGALDGEIERFEDLERRVGDVDGLREALRARRALELDRLAIDALTGVGEG